MNHPVISFIQKSLHNQVVEVDEVEHAMRIPPHGDGGKPNVCLCKAMVLEYLGEHGNAEYLDCSICNHPGSDFCDVALPQNIHRTFCL